MMMWDWGCKDAAAARSHRSLSRSLVRSFARRRRSQRNAFPLTPKAPNKKRNFPNLIAPPHTQQTMNLYKWPALRLALIPGLAEALFDAGLGVALFGMPIMLALAMGFILKAVGPGLVVPAMFQLQHLGLGAEKGEKGGRGGKKGRERSLELERVL